jgi:hypothetical protein
MTVSVMSKDCVSDGGQPRPLLSEARQREGGGRALRLHIKWIADGCRPVTLRNSAHEAHWRGGRAPCQARVGDSSEAGPVSGPAHSASD